MGNRSNKIKQGKEQCEKRIPDVSMQKHSNPKILQQTENPVVFRIFIKH